MTPIHLQRLIEIACSPAVESCPHVMRRTGELKPLDDLQSWGLIERVESDPANENYCPHGWDVTEKGRVHVDRVCETPLPEKRWV